MKLHIKNDHVSVMLWETARASVFDFKLSKYVCCACFVVHVTKMFKFKSFRLHAADLFVVLFCLECASQVSRVATCNNNLFYDPTEQTCLNTYVFLMPSSVTPW